MSNIVSNTDTSGKFASVYTYDTWGKPLTTNIIDSKLTDQPIRYASYYYDVDLALYYLMARYYHPEQAVFLSIDPELDSDETVSMANGYSYADNNPALKVDPDGTWAWVAVKAGYGAFTGYQTAKSRGYTGWEKWGYTAYSAVSSATGFGKIYKAGRSLYSVHKKKHTVYALRDRVTNEVKYIGRTVNEKSREYQHSTSKDTRKRGLRFDPLCRNLNYSQARGMEHRMFRKHRGFNKLYNVIRPIGKNNKKGLRYVLSTRRIKKR